MTDLTIQTERELIPVLRSSLYPGASDDSIKMVIAYCTQAKLDPLQKPVHIVPMWDRNAGAMRDVIMPGIGLYRTQAARSGEYGGMSDPEFGEDVSAKIGGQEITYPKSCKVTVYRLVQGQPVGFSATEFWLENYAMKGGRDKSTAPNAMWTKRPYGQIAKCAEAQALRKAFPEFGSMPTAEEMEGKETFERDITPQVEEIIDVSAEILAIENAESLQELQAIFGSAWKDNQDKDARARLQAAYEPIKRELIERQAND